MSSFPLTDKFTRALQTAAAWHHGQYHKVPTGEAATLPYLSHLLGVASIALEFGAGEVEAIAALLHDALEDGPEFTGKDASELRELIVADFGEEVARLVDAATDATPRAGEEKAPWPLRKMDYLRSLASKDASALLVSAADKLHNARSILVDVLPLAPEDRRDYFRRFRQGQEGTLQYYRLLVDHYHAAPGAAGHSRLQSLFAELDRTVTAVETACGLSAAQVRALPHLKGAQG